MTETTAEFLERFKATGLDMLCDARRRAEQLTPWHWKWGSPTGRNSIWKSAALGVSYPGQFFLDLDYSGIEERIISMTTPEGPYKDRFRRMFETDPATYIIESDSGEIRRMEPVYNWPLHAYQEQALNRLTREARNQRIVIDREAWRDMAFTRGRRVGHQSYLRQATAAMLMVAAFHEPIPAWEEPLKPPGRSLGPGKEVEDEGERRYDKKQIAKARKRKKLAKKSRK